MTFETPTQHEQGVLDPNSALGGVVLAALARQRYELELAEISAFTDPHMTILPGGRHNLGIAVHDQTEGQAVLCRIPRSDIETDQGLYTDYIISSTVLPAGVGPESYAFDVANPARPVHILELKAGQNLPYAAWKDETLADFGHKLGLTHQVPLRPKAPDLMGVFMRPLLPERIAAVRGAEATKLVQAVQLRTAHALERVQPLFDRAPLVALNHNDLLANNVIIGQDQRVSITDWEFAGPGHPDLEIGSFYYPGVPFRDFRAGLGERQEGILLNAYTETVGQDPERLVRIRTAQYIDLARMVISLTALIDSGTVDTYDMTPEELRSEQAKLHATWSGIRLIAEDSFPQIRE